MKLTNVCQYCNKESHSVVDVSNPELATSTLIYCDCKESREAWETAHRAAMEQRKNANRSSGLRSGKTIGPRRKR